MHLCFSLFGDADTHQPVRDDDSDNGAGVFQKYRDSDTEFHTDNEIRRLALWYKKEPASSFCALGVRLPGPDHPVLRGGARQPGRRVHDDEAVAFHDNAVGGDLPQRKDPQSAGACAADRLPGRGVRCESGIQFEPAAAFHGVPVRVLFQRVIHAAGVL